MVSLRVTFTGDSVQGKQNLITVEDYECGAGCTPKIDGLGLQTRQSFSNVSYINEYQGADANSYECGRRGKCDYTTGICQCFAGYTGLSCSTVACLV